MEMGLGWKKISDLPSLDELTRLFHRHYKNGDNAPLRVLAEDVFRTKYLNYLEGWWCALTFRCGEGKAVLAFTEPVNNTSKAELFVTVEKVSADNYSRLVTEFTNEFEKRFCPQTASEGLRK